MISSSIFFGASLNWLNVGIPTISATHSEESAKSGRLRSEWVAGMNRKARPSCVGIPNGLEIPPQRPEGRPAQLPQQSAVILEEQPQPLGHPLAPRLDPLGVARGAESPRPAGEHQEAFLGAVRAPDAGEPAAGVAAIEIPLHDLLDYRPEISVFPLEATLVLRQKSLEMMKHHPVERRPLRMPGTIDSRHSKSQASKNGPTSGVR